MIIPNLRPRLCARVRNWFDGGGAHVVERLNHHVAAVVVRRDRTGPGTIQKIIPFHSIPFRRISQPSQSHCYDTPGVSSTTAAAAAAVLQ
jgi:hypothetical protein